MRHGHALKRITDQDGERHERVEVYHIETSADMLALRQDPWTDGRMRALEYNSAPAQGFIRNEPPARSLRLLPGAYVGKTAAGIFVILHEDEQKGFTEA